LRTAFLAELVLAMVYLSSKLERRPGVAKNRCGREIAATWRGL